jgi:hypothetical protein
MLAILMLAKPMLPIPITSKKWPFCNWSM